LEEKKEALCSFYAKRIKKRGYYISAKKENQERSFPSLPGREEKKKKGGKKTLLYYPRGKKRKK